MIDRLAELLAAFDGAEAWEGEAPVNMLATFTGVFTDVNFYRHENGGFAKPSHAKEFAPVLAGPRQVRETPPSITRGEAFFEAAAVMRAARSARDRFAVVELGGGYGARAVDALAAVRLYNPMPATAVVVEPVPGHIVFAKQHFVNNGFPPEKHWFPEAAVAVKPEPLLMPLGTGRYGNTAEAWNIYEILANRVLINFENARKAAMMLARNKRLNLADDSGAPAGSFGYVSAVTLTDILFPFEKVDLIDMDIQGGERDVAPHNMSLLKQKVKLMNIGTHGHDIHAELSAAFRSAGWDVLADFAPDTAYETPYGAFKTGDGVLMVENPDQVGG
jgi:hypothetical protein